ATRRPSVDDPSYLVTFLGGPGDHDAPAHDFAPTVVADLRGTSASSIELYYTRYGGNPSVQKVQVTFTGSSLLVGAPVTVTQDVPADGALFLPDGRLVVANGSVSFINPITGAFTSVDGRGAEHMALDPGGTKIWTSPQPGTLVEIP